MHKLKKEKIYEVFNENNTLIKVSESDLDYAEKEKGLVPVHIANAAIKAGRRGFIYRLRETLTSTKYFEKLTAAYALLFFKDEGSIPYLEQLAISETHEALKYTFKAIIIRLTKEKNLIEVFIKNEDKKLSGFLISTYLNPYVLEKKDVEFLLYVLNYYICKSISYIKNLSKDLYENDLLIILFALDEEKSLKIINELNNEKRKKLKADLEKIDTMRFGDGDIRKCVKTLLFKVNKSSLNL